MEFLATITVGQVVCAALTVALIHDIATRLRNFLAERNFDERTDP